MSINFIFQGTFSFIVRLSGRRYRDFLLPIYSAPLEQSQCNHPGIFVTISQPVLTLRESTAVLDFLCWVLQIVLGECTRFPLL